MRRGTWAVLLGALALGTSGCGSTATGPVPSGGEHKMSIGGSKVKLQVGIVFDTGGLGDKSFNDSAWRGAQRCEKELGVTVFKVESAKESDYAGNLTAMADKKCDIVIGVGISMATAVEQIAPNYPSVKFVCVDGEPSKQPNVQAMRFKEEEGSFLVGYVAGLMTKTGKIGFVGGMELPLIRKFQYGYMAGAKMARPDVEPLPAKFTGDWVNQDKARVAADLLFGSGADIVYHAAGRAGLGVIAAANQDGRFAIGVDSDQDDVAAGHVLTSMIKHVDEGVFLTVQELAAGNFTAGAVEYDLKSGGVGTSEFTQTKELIGPTNLKKLAIVKDRIVKGEIRVPSDEAGYNGFIAGLK